LPDGLSLSSAGVLAGTPTNAGTFSFILQVADNVSATATEIFTVEIRNNASTILVQNCTNGSITLLVSGDPGLNYGIEFSTNLVVWQEAFATNSPTVPFLWTDTNASSLRTHFYRARSGP
jgi:hypothetical protein